ncbi:DUF4142 domain-containing protein [Streptomyces sp. WAC06614]|uniref:DUF4142 domain-containing protein n=1 Tax=Streptomyces sp. WAC06614 TaxID=2487416 RepID=UPI000F76E323|nr:DUF4142 domain-containing protein [Streptomyces sp. WAC06614]RSS58257.1 DUF4142 domain-containing protein [Streptomyces sp. WAC06614]
MRHSACTAACVLAAAAGLCAPAAHAAPYGSNDDEKFVVAVHQANLAEIAAGEDAGKNAQDSCVKDVGALLVKDHTKLDADVKELADKLNITLPATPTPEQQQQLKNVQQKAGSPDYDKSWLTLQETGHKATLALLDQQVDTGGNPDVTAAAEKARPVVSMHLDMVRGGTCHPMS